MMKRVVRIRRLVAFEGRCIRRGRVIVTCLTLAGTAGACLGGPPSPPALAYGEGSAGEVVYDFSDTTVVEVSMMGQSMEVRQEGTGSFDVAFVPREAGGVDVSLSLRSLSGSLGSPMTAPVRLDDSAMTGTLAFSLDRIGDVTLTTLPTVAQEASVMISGLGLAYDLFPGLPGRAAAPGESWVDTVSYDDDDSYGSRSETAVLRYTVVGDTVIGTRPLLLISMEGSSTMSADLNISGMAVAQTADLDIEGHVLWDYQSGRMVERLRRSSGPGSVRAAMLPTELPIRIRTQQLARLQPNPR